jgi:hypothetical protein
MGLASQLVSQLGTRPEPSSVLIGALVVAGLFAAYLAIERVFGNGLSALTRRMWHRISGEYDRANRPDRD